MTYPLPRKYILTLQIILLLIKHAKIFNIVLHVAAKEYGDLQFSYVAGFNSTVNSLVSSGSVQFSESGIWMLYDPESSASNLTNEIWRVAYNQPITFSSDSSFNTSLTFQTTVTGQAQTIDCPSGIAFSISTHGSTPSNNSGGRYFGLVDPVTINSTTKITTDPFFAVVFDMAKDVGPGLNDPSDSYIGIDVSSLQPSTFVDTSDTSSYYPELYLCRNATFTVWIVYNASSKTTEVRMTANSSIFNFSEAPQILLYKRDLWSTFSQSVTWYFALSATNYKVGSSPSKIAIHSWNFTVDNIGYSGASPKLKVILPLVLAISCTLIASIIILTSYIFHRRRFSNRNNNIHHIQSIANLHRFSYRELKASTQGFDPNTSLIGEGGFSKVYKGELPDGSIVAIKRLKDSLRKEVEFTSELRIISNIRHRNLLQLHGWSYDDKGEALLVYTFMKNGSLERYLFGSKKCTLNGDTRLRILQGVAIALEYLHSGLGECILHRDIKAANVLLTKDFEAVLGDFGLARLIKHDAIVTGTMVGTPGYVAPEVFMTAKVTDKSDVYSFGVLMLEVACGSPAINRSPDTNHSYLVEWISRLYSNGNVFQGLDPTILILSPHPQVKEQWKHVLELALVCCHPSPNNRPPMKHVKQYIQDIINDPWQIPSLPDNYNISDERGYSNYLNFFSV